MDNFIEHVITGDNNILPFFNKQNFTDK